MSHRVLGQAIPGLEKMERQALFKPIVGILVSLHRHNPSTHALVVTCARHPLVATGNFEFICNLEWQFGAEICAESVQPAMEVLRAFTELLKQAMADASDLGDELGEIPDVRPCHSSCAPLMLLISARVSLGATFCTPQDFLDPITMELMDNPVILPASSVSVDRGTIARHLLSDQTDPFNRSRLTMEMVKTDHALIVRSSHVYIAFRRAPRYFGQLLT